MGLQEIHAQQSHRPWPIPNRPWQFYQEWNRTIFLHWKVDPELLRKWVPEAFEIDLFEGSAWISVVAFDMDKVRPRYLPAFAPVSNFLEVNVRTYIRHLGRSTVYFLSLEANNRLSAWLARSISGLPYHYSRMQRTDQGYESKNEKYGDHFRIQYQLGNPLAEKSEAALWLSERYGLHHDVKNEILSFDIHHVEWPMFEIQIKDLQISYPRFQALLEGPPDLVNYSSGVQVLTWGKEAV